MRRPTPTKDIILALGGNDHGLLSSAHHGLYEVPLSDFYPHLDLDEVIAFAASSWQARAINNEDFMHTLESGDIYRIFNQVYGIGFPWLVKNMSVPEKLKKKYDQLNPFHGKDLKERLATVEAKHAERLVKNLKELTNEYVFEGQYRGIKMARDGDNYDLVVMTFQNAYPEKGRIVPAFAAEIARIISSYPAEYEPLRETVLAAQPTLF